MRSLIALVVATLVSGCGGRGTPEPDAGSDALSGEERSVADRGGESSNASQQLTVLANSLFDFDPTIDAARTAAENAAALETNVRTNLGSADGGVGCGTVSLSGTTVTVAFGPPPGCTLRNGEKISGTVAVGVTKTGSTITLSLTMTQIVANGVPLSGMATFSTTNGSTFTINGSVTSGATTWTFTNLTATGATGTTTINGTVAITGDSNTSMTYANLTWRLGDCYPNGGSVTSKKGLITTVITFDTNTPATGLVTVTVGRKSSRVPLPVYGSCGTP